MPNSSNIQAQIVNIVSQSTKTALWTKLIQVAVLIKAKLAKTLVHYLKEGIRDHSKYATRANCLYLRGKKTKSIRVANRTKLKLATSAYWESKLLFFRVKIVYPRSFASTELCHHLFNLMRVTPMVLKYKPQFSKLLNLNN